MSHLNAELHALDYLYIVHNICHILYVTVLRMVEDSNTFARWQHKHARIHSCNQLILLCAFQMRMIATATRARMEGHVWTGMETSRVCAPATGRDRTARGVTQHLLNTILVDTY